jgi:hypothetical protein
MPNVIDFLLRQGYIPEGKPSGPASLDRVHATV